MKKILCLFIFLGINRIVNAQNAPFDLWGSGLDGSVLQKTTIYSDTSYGLLIEAPLNSSNVKLPVEFNWRGGGVPALKINPNGNVGLGTTSPIDKLEVAGGIHTTGTAAMSKSSEMYLDYYSGGGRFGSMGPDNNTNGTISFTTYRANGTNGLTPLFINTVGNVGIGTNSPSQILEIAKSQNANTFINVVNPSNGASAIASLRAFVSYNNAITMGVTSSGSSEQLGYIDVEGNFPLIFKANSAEKMRVTNNGNVGIGTTTPDSKLTVAGKIHSQEVKVSVTAGADFVFDKKYQLPPLAETERYISEKKHLPEMASANEMKKNGIELGEMNVKLLQKIEELTLHLINQNKQIEEQRFMLEQQDKRLKKLEKK